MPFYTSATLPRNVGWASSETPPPSFSHQFATLHRPSPREENPCRRSVEESSPFFLYPMQFHPSIIHPLHSHNQQVVPYPISNQMLPSMASSIPPLPPSSQPSFHPQISYNPPIIQQSSESQQMWCGSPSAYPVNPSQVVYFSPYTSPPSAFLPSKDSLSDCDYDSFPSDCCSLCCHGFTQLLWILLLILFIAIIGAFLLGLFSL
ncbi:hypothetical protein PMAYCL1PPCAC_18416 [Pristionchus mayeri]|uniref:Uncharacterized protein n=1 Tax=Pristionchus mayeri TaxID=1317129 RepID=A0AAN5CPG1_9BILA|nr:hypothetical protein PMAYCL1PPCAC_18416 [Pristionchus mayeri]